MPAHDAPDMHSELFLNQLSRLSLWITSILPMPPAQKQKLLCSDNVIARIEENAQVLQTIVGTLPV
jgi:hypothetical protein